MRKSWYKGRYGWHNRQLINKLEGWTRGEVFLSLPKHKIWPVARLTRADRDALLENDYAKPSA